VVLSLRGRQITVLPHIPGNIAYVKALKKTLPLCDGYHCVSEDIMREAEKYGLVKYRARVIRTSVDTKFFFPRDDLRDRQTRKIKLVNVGTSNWRKGIEYLLQALRIILDEGNDIQLDVVDSGRDENEKQRALSVACDLDIKKHVNMLGKLSPEGVRNVLWNSDIFVLSSLTEGISNAVVEAMACGMPIVTTDCGGMSEAVTNGKEGFLVQVRDPKKMAISIMQLIDNRELRVSMGEKAREKVMADFSAEKQARKFIEFYNEVAERCRE
jgi:colanic acid/amylovoran biosynthesis glycosyltransferase